MARWASDDYVHLCVCGFVVANVTFEDRPVWSIVAQCLASLGVVVDTLDSLETCTLESEVQSTAATKQGQHAKVGPAILIGCMHCDTSFAHDANSFACPRQDRARPYASLELQPCMMRLAAPARLRRRIPSARFVD